MTWTSPAAITLADYQISEDAAYMLILRTRCYAFTQIAAAPGFGLFSPAPTGFAYWQYTDVSTATNAYRVTNRVQLHLLCDTDEFVIGKGDHRLALIAELDAPPDANARLVRTLVYGYLIGALIADKLGGSESTYFAT